MSVVDLVVASTFLVAGAAVDLDDHVVVVVVVMRDAGLLHDVPRAPIHESASEVRLHDVVVSETDQVVGDVLPEGALAEDVGLEGHVMTGYGGHDHVVATR